MALSREHILNTSDLPREEVQVPEWGGSVFVRCLTGTERDAIEARYARDGQKNLRAQVAAASICDEAGKALFTVADVEALGRKSVSALDRISTVSNRLSKFSGKDVEELAGNSSANPPGGSASGSPESSDAPSASSSSGSAQTN